jgi:hypothetical protein
VEQVDLTGLERCDTTSMCPSAQPDMANAVVIGVIDSDADMVGDRALIAYVDEHVEVTRELLAITGNVAPTKVFRFAATCEESSCGHFVDDRCSLVERVVANLPSVVSFLPRCSIRSTCRWYGQQGRQACFRCPQVVTEQAEPTSVQSLVATPPTPKLDNENDKNMRSAKSTDVVYR